jgi:hypothetical protein
MFGPPFRTGRGMPDPFVAPGSMELGKRVGPFKGREGPAP